MKKLFLLSSLLLLSLSVSAQRIDKPNEPYDFYCSVINAVVCVNVIMGEENDKFVLLNDDGSKVKNEYEVFYLTYMSKRGWEYVDRFNSAYIFKKKVTSDDEAYKSLNIVYEKGKNKGKPRELF